MKTSNVEWAVFRDPRNREEYTVTDNDCIKGFCASRSCDCCIVGDHLDYDEYGKCSDWVKDHPLEAAEGMGYKFVSRRWKDGRMETREDLEREKNKNADGLPFLCRWLTMQPGTVIRVDYWDWEILDDGTLRLVGGGVNRLAEVQALYKILEHPELVEVAQREITESELETLSWLRKFLPRGWIRMNDKENGLEVLDGHGKWVVLTISTSLFPSVKSGWLLSVENEKMVMDKEG